MKWETRQLKVEEPAEIAEAAQLLRRGGLVAFPTETVYGLGADALDAAAVAGIFVAKERPAWDPLIVHLASAEDVEIVAEVGERFRSRVEALAAAFWPGPLTMLLPRTRRVPDVVTAGRGRVGVRVPAHPVARALIAQAGVPVAAPSANRFGHTSPTTAAHVLADLDGRIDAVLDGGACAVGVESTVLDVCESPMIVYRPGAVTLAMIAEVAGAVELYRGFAGGGREEAVREGLPSPGVGLRHYAPRARLLLVQGEEELAAECARQGQDRAAGVMLPDGWAALASQVYRWGPWGRLDVLARRLFAGLRELDEAGVSVILCPLPAEGDGLNAALRDRLLKAAMR